MKILGCSLLVGTGLCVAMAGGAWAAGPGGPGPSWAALSASQKTTLAPLQRDWPTLETQRKQKWLEVASRFETMSAEERVRVAERMAEWARMTPTQRTRARLQFQEARQVPPDERQARWQAYQALSPEERKALAQRAKPAVKTAAGATSGAPAHLNGSALVKRNLVQVPAPQTPVKAIAPTVQQAKPGATTTAISVRANPPLHHQTGMPKIAATPGFVDPTTLLPKRGPQGAAARPVASRDPAASQP